MGNITRKNGRISQINTKILMLKALKNELPLALVKILH